MDKVTLSDASAAYAQYELIGPGCEALLEMLGGPHGGVTGQVFEILLDGDLVRLLRQDTPHQFSFSPGCAP